MTSMTDSRTIITWEAFSSERVTAYTEEQVSTIVETTKSGGG